ncbi:hypothetical protein F4803DRAFT_545197 [Xylaria telfairii]|nr:hypothetical protein F4803DRAFT_545197 [Xylaria telfairii]
MLEALRTYTIMPSSKPPKIYFLLPEPLPGHFVSTFLGRLVVNKSRPTDSYGPDIKVDLRSIVPDLYDEPASFGDVTKVLQTARRHDAQLTITKLLEVFRSHSSDSGKTVEAPLFRRYRMTRIPQKFESLRGNDAYAKEIQELGRHLKQGQHLSLVTGLLTCSNHKLTEHNGDVSSSGGRVGIPSEAIQAAGGPPGAGMNISARGEESRHTSGSAKAVGEMVLAVSYHELYYDKQRATKSLFRRCLPWKTNKNTLKLVPIVGKPAEGDLEGFFSADQARDNLTNEEDGEPGHTRDATNMNGDDLYDFQLELECAS